MSFHELAGHILRGAVTLSLLLLGAALLLTLIRIVRGPTLADRVLGLDMLTAIAIGFIAVFGLASGFTLYLDIAISLGLVGFLATVAFARFIVAASRDRETGRLLFDDPRRDRRPQPPERS